MERRDGDSVSEDRCVFCGEIIAEGTQVCLTCRSRVMKQYADGWLARDAPVCPKRESLIIGYRYTCQRCGKEVRFELDRYCPSCGQRQSWEKWKERRNDHWKNT